MTGNGRNSKLHNDMRSLAGGINHAITTLNAGQPLDFMLVVVIPAGDDEVTLNTITGIQDPYHIARIGQHLIDMAKAQIAAAKEPPIDPGATTN